MSLEDSPHSKLVPLMLSGQALDKSGPMLDPLLQGHKRSEYRLDDLT